MIHRNLIGTYTYSVHSFNFKVFRGNLPCIARLQGFQIDDETTLEV